MNTTQTQEIFLSDLDYDYLKQYFAYSLSKKVSLDEALILFDAFDDLYHNVSYFVPTEIVSDKFATIKFVVELMKKDLPESN